MIPWFRQYFVPSVSTAQWLRAWAQEHDCLGSNPKSTTSWKSLFTSLNEACPIYKTGLIMGFKEFPYSNGMWAITTMGF